jgi:hypothetical protein
MYGVVTYKRFTKKAIALVCRLHKISHATGVWWEVGYLKFLLCRSIVFSI